MILPLTKRGSSQIPPQGKKALSADHVPRDRGGRFDISLTTWPFDTISGQPGVKRKETVRFRR